jgi:hypothetical protein
MDWQVAGGEDLAMEVTRLRAYLDELRDTLHGHAAPAPQHVRLSLLSLCLLFCFSFSLDLVCG